MGSNDTRKPVFGLRAEYRPYKCSLCGHKKDISTNHTSTCLAHCEECSWKSEGFGPGVRMFGTWHRTFIYDGPEDAVLKLRRYTAQELAALETIEEHHWDNVKIQTDTHRVKLSRCGRKDGAQWDNGVIVDQLIRGVWTVIEEYPG